MKITNTFSLPQPFIDAVTTDNYVRGKADFTATELTSPTRILSLRRKHESDLVEDASNMLWRLQGSAKHVIFEKIAKANPGRYIVEQRYEATMPGGVTISGQIDLFDRETSELIDWKECSRFKFQLGDLTEWTAQANILLYLMRMNDVFPKAIRNVALLRDWKAREARFSRDKDYPKCPVNICTLESWSVGQQQDYILERIKAHQDNMTNPPVCTKKERWQRDASFAVMRTDRKRALRLYMDKDQAEAAMLQAMRIAPPGDAKKFFIEERNAEPVRCLDFCPVQLQCDFGIEAEAKWNEKHKHE